MLLIFIVRKCSGKYVRPSKYHWTDASSVISKLLTHIVNWSETTGDIPAYLKMAMVFPLYRENNETDVANYRHSSVLRIISEVFETMSSINSITS